MEEYIMDVEIDNERTTLKTFYGDLVELGDAVVAFKIKN
mgnify:CR=1 FL=1